MQSLRVVAFSLASLWASQAYPTGPHESACLTQFPKHHGDNGYVEAKLTGSPFIIQLPNGTYSPGQNITVNIITTNDNSTFRGFQLTAHRVAESGNTQELLGTFSIVDNTTKVMPCVGQPRKMFGHASNINRTMTTAIWTAPAQNVGDIEFRATVVETFSIIWYGLSATLPATPGLKVIPPENIMPTVRPQRGLPDWSQCGKTKGCFLHPMTGSSSCSGDDCQAAVSYRQEGDLFSFEMSAAGQDSFVALGFSDDKIMTDDQVIVCTAIPGLQSVQLSYNPEKYTYRQYTMGMSNLTTRQENGRMYCTFTREAALTSIKDDGFPRIFDLSRNPYFLFLAWGDILKGTDVMAKHLDLPAISAEPLDLTVIISSSIKPSSVVFLLIAGVLISIFGSIH